MKSDDEQILPGLPSLDDAFSSDGVKTDEDEEQAIFNSLKEAFSDQVNAEPSPFDTDDKTSPGYEPPEVNAAELFGIPAPPLPNDPALKKLSLETIQQDNTPFDTRAESPFPDPDDIEEEGASRSGSGKWQTEPMSAEKIAEALPQDIESLLELCELAPNASSSSDFLMLAAYFLCVYKQMDTFALKDLNAQLVRSGLTPVNHSILEAVLAESYLGLIPDLTGTANSAEYTLTDAGRAYTENLFSF